MLRMAQKIHGEQEKFVEKKLQEVMRDELEFSLVKRELNAYTESELWLIHRMFMAHAAPIIQKERQDHYQRVQLYQEELGDLKKMKSLLCHSSAERVLRAIRFLKLLRFLSGNEALRTNPAKPPAKEQKASYLPVLLVTGG